MCFFNQCCFFLHNFNIYDLFIFENKKWFESVLNFSDLHSFFLKSEFLFSYHLLNQLLVLLIIQMLFGDFFEQEDACSVQIIKLYDFI